MKPRIIITGGSGFLAVNWAILRREEADICLLLHNNAVELAGVESIKAELSDDKQIASLIESWKPDIIINTVGMTNVDLCELEKQGAVMANITVPSKVAQAAKAYGVKLVHISTDQVFAGDSSWYVETDKACPLNEYGRSKLLGETSVAEIYQDSLIVRTNFYGWGTPLKESISDWVIHSVRNDVQIPAFDDVYFTPIFIGQLIEAVELLLGSGSSGVFHLGGKQRLSKYGFALEVAKHFDLDQSLVKRASINDLEMVAERPRDMSLRSELASASSGWTGADLGEGLRMLREQEFSGHRQIIESGFSK